jgi:hypothetical protein
MIVLVWANLHGSFVLGPMVLGLAWLEDVHDRVARPHRALAVATISCLAACVTPFGPAVWAYAVGLSVNPEVTRRITEWQPTSLRDVQGLLFFGSVVAVIALLARRGSVVAWPTLAWLGTFFAIGAYAVRGIAWWPLGAVVALAGLLAVAPIEEPDRATVHDAEPQLRRLNAMVAGGLIVAAIAMLPLWRPVDPGTGAPVGVLANAPSGITAALRDLARPGDRLFNPQVWGSWFEFAVPQLPVAIDSRIEFFPAEVWDTYDVARGSDAAAGAQLRRWKVTLAVVGANELPLLNRLNGMQWQTVYQGDDGWILVSPDR